MAEKTHLKGEIPDSVFNAELQKYLLKKESTPKGKNTPSQFEYKGKKYYFESSQTQSGYRVRRSEDFVKKEQRRRENLNKPKLSSIEQKMVDNYYQEASERGLHVDHRIPAKMGGMHHPSNLGLMQPGENIRKGSKTGGQYKYEPLIDNVRQKVRFRDAIQTDVSSGGLGNKDMTGGGLLDFTRDMARQRTFDPGPFDALPFKGV